MLTVFTILVLVLAVLLSKLFVIVPQHQNLILERLGNFRANLQPGFHLCIPIIDRVAYRHDIREQVIDIPAQTCITRDNIQVAVDGLVYMKVMDAKRASYGIGNYILASINLAQTTMRSEVGKLSLSETFAERDRLNDAIIKEIDKASDPWGIKVMSYEVRNITPSLQVIHTLEKQMEAERAKRAEITLAQADRESKILISEGVRQEAINISEGERERRINQARGRAQEISTVAEATSAGIRRVAAAINQPGGSLAVKMKLTEEFIQKMQEIYKTAKVSVLPSDLANLRGVIQSIGRSVQSQGPVTTFVKEKK